MLFASSLAVALLSIAPVFGADCSGSANVTAQSDLDDLSSCSTYKGDITITGSSLISASLSGVKTITGDLVFSNVTELSSFTAPDLQKISGTFEVNVATVLSVFSFPKLTQVGSINWVTLPSLSDLSFDSFITNATDVIISDTSLSSLNGINVNEVATFNVNNNKYLNEISVDLYTVSNALDISFNSNDLEADFPHLVWANNMTFRDVASVSFPKLSNVNASLGFINNSISGLAAPALKTVGGSLAITSNSQLSNVSFPKLQSIGGGFVIANNTALKTILGFPSVKTVGGAIEFIGNFSAASLDSLTLVKGGVEIESSSDKFNCSSFNKAHSDGDIQGDSYECKAKSTSTSVAITSTKTSTDDSSSSTGSASATTTSTHKNGGAKLAAIPSDFGATTVIGAVAAFILQFV